MFVLSRKTRLSIQRCVDSLVCGTFSELTIKELMIDLRELARSAPNIGLDDPKFQHVFLEFVDVCDFIAHSNRTKGIFEAKIREQAERMADALASGDERRWQEVTAVPLVANMETIVSGLLGTAFLFLTSFDKALTSTYLEPAYRRRDEIALCIISLLQDSVIQLKDNCGVAVLHVLTHDGLFRLYCRIHGSRIETDARSRTQGTGRVVIGFPVLVTMAPDTDRILPSYTSGFTQEISDRTTSFTPPPVIETYRDASGKLCVRLIDV
jgi:hypothetical protein